MSERSDEGEVFRQGDENRREHSPLAIREPAHVDNRCEAKNELRGPHVPTFPRRVHPARRRRPHSNEAGGANGSRLESRGSCMMKTESLSDQDRSASAAYNIQVQKAWSAQARLGFLCSW